MITDTERAYLTMAKFALEKARHEHIFSRKQQYESGDYARETEIWRVEDNLILDAEEKLEALLNYLW